MPWENVCEEQKYPDQPAYSETCVRKPPSRLTLVVDVERWQSYKGTCHVILLVSKITWRTFIKQPPFHINHYLKSVSQVALLHRFHCGLKRTLLYTSLQSSRKGSFLTKTYWHFVISTQKHILGYLLEVPRQKHFMRGVSCKYSDVFVK